VLGFVEDMLLKERSLFTWSNIIVTVLYKIDNYNSFERLNVFTRDYGAMKQLHLKKRICRTKLKKLSHRSTYLRAIQRGIGRRLKRGARSVCILGIYPLDMYGYEWRRAKAVLDDLKRYLRYPQMRRTTEFINNTGKICKGFQWDLLIRTSRDNKRIPEEPRSNGPCSRVIVDIRVDIRNFSWIFVRISMLTRLI